MSPKPGPVWLNAKEKAWEPFRDILHFSQQDPQAAHNTKTTQGFASSTAFTVHNHFKNYRNVFSRCWEVHQKEFSKAFWKRERAKGFGVLTLMTTFSNTLLCNSSRQLVFRNPWASGLYLRLSYRHHNQSRLWNHDSRLGQQGVTLPALPCQEVKNRDHNAEDPQYFNDNPSIEPDVPWQNALG